MKTIQYHCKFCDKPGTVTYEPPPPGLIINVESFIPNLACDKCAKYQRQHRDLLHAISHTAVKLGVIRFNLSDSGSDDRQTLEARIRSKLIDLTKRFATVICNYWHRPFTWEPDFVDMIMDNPNRAFDIATKYLNMIRKQAEQQ